MKGMMLMQ